LSDNTKNIVQSLTNPPTMQLHFPLYDNLYNMLITIRHRMLMKI
jgi:hypothetical protein